jgi:hypothetical protein
MNVDQIKAKLESGEHILTERKQAESEVWKSFREVRDAATNEKIGAVHCVKCQSVSTYSAINPEVRI